MAIEFIPNQTVLFTSDDQPCKNVDSSIYPQPLQQDDLLCIQFKNTPCGDNLFTCEQPNTSNILPNGTFDTSTGWVLDTGWTIASGLLTHTAGTGLAGYTLGTLVNGDDYLVIYTITTISAGSVRVQLGDGAGATQGLVRTTVGSYAEVLTWTDVADNKITFNPSNDFAGSIDWVYIFPLATSLCLISDLDNEGIQGWTLAEGDYTHVTGNVTPIFTNVGPIAAQDELYQVLFTIENMTAGTLTPAWVYLSDSSVHPFTPVGTGNGTWAGYDAPGEDAELGFVPSTDFDGTLSISISVKLMNTDHVIKLVDLDDNVASETLSAGSGENTISYFADYMSICLNFDTIDTFDVPGEKIASGCYKVQVTDDCSSTTTESTTIINYKKTGEHRCTKYIEAYCSDYGHNFYFGTAGSFFKLTMRASVLRISPKYPGDIEQYTKSTGRHQLLYASSQKQWTLWLDKMDEWAHDVMRTIRICDVATIEGEQYFFPDESYEPEFTEKMDRNLAQARTTIQKIQDVISNRYL